MADNVKIDVVIDGNNDTTWATSDAAIADIDAAFAAAGVTPILEQQVTAGNMTVAHTLVDNNTIKYTYTWSDANLVGPFFRDADFSATNGVVETNDWAAQGTVTFLNNQTQTFNLGG
jgi:hypothetical protein